MSRAKKIKYIVIHCSAGWGDYKSMENYWFTPKNKGGLGWKTGGYNRGVLFDGTILKPYSFETITNGVGGFNEDCIHIFYQGGIDKTTKKTKDTRSEEQKAGIITCIVEVFEWLHSEGVDTSEAGNQIIILGHRDFSEDKNRNGIIDPNERIKDCPCFDALEEYKWITYTNKKNYTLPKNRK